MTSAADLPYASVVAIVGDAAAWTKEQDSGAYPWAATNEDDACSDEHVDRFLRSGEAMVLRVGGGVR